MPVSRPSSSPVSGPSAPPLAEAFDFHHLAERPFYERCREWLLRRCDVAWSPLTVVDLGCGPGLLTALLLDRFEHHDGLRVMGIDPCEAELSFARRVVSDRRVEFLNGRAQQLRDVVSGAGIVLMCNVLHQIPVTERHAVFEGIHEALRPGGVVAFNTLYYEGAVMPETKAFYSYWLLSAFEELGRCGLQPHPPRQAPAFERLTVAEHRELLNAAGFEDPLMEELIFEWSVDDWKALSRYSVFIRNTFGDDIDLETGSRALQRGVEVTYQELGLKTVPRGWLHGVARRWR